MTAAALARRPQARLVRETASGVRTHSLVAFWAVVLLALPLWWGSTAVERLSLPALSPAARAQFEVRLRAGRSELEGGVPNGTRTR